MCYEELTRSDQSNVSNIVIYGALELSYIFNCAANFALADHHMSASETLTKVAGAFGFISALTGFYVVLSELCQDALPLEVHLGDTSRVFRKSRRTQT